MGSHFSPFSPPLCDVMWLFFTSCQYFPQSPLNLLYIPFCLSLSCPQMHNLLLNFFLVCFLDHLSSVGLPPPASDSCGRLSCPLCPCLRFLPGSCPHFSTFLALLAPSSAVHNHFLCHLLTLSFTFPLLYPSLSVAPCLVSVQCPWGSSPHPCSRCSMPLAGQAWALWASPSGCWPTTLKWRSRRWTSITTRWTLSLTSAHEESTGNR